MPIHTKVYKLIKKYKTRDPFELADYQNITIRYDDLPSNIRGLAVKSLRRKYIVLNNDIHHYEARLVCAHELGHHNCHSGHSYQFIEEHSLFVLGKYEREANEFAATLLIDPTTIEYGDTDRQIAEKANVPIELIKYYKIK